MPYRCPGCGSPNPNLYLKCASSICPDGQDQGRPRSVRGQIMHNVARRKQQLRREFMRRSSRFLLAGAVLIILAVCFFGFGVR